MTRRSLLLLIPKLTVTGDNYFGDIAKDILGYVSRVLTGRRAGFTQQKMQNQQLMQMNRMKRRKAHVTYGKRKKLMSCWVKTRKYLIITSEFLNTAMRPRAVTRTA
jgi:hypothetical protein